MDAGWSILFVDIFTIPCLRRYQINSARFHVIAVSRVAALYQVFFVLRRLRTSRRPRVFGGTSITFTEVFRPTLLKQRFIAALIWLEMRDRGSKIEALVIDL